MAAMQEVENLMDRGIKGSGQGFDAKSMGRIGAHGFIPTHNVPEHQRRDAMLKVCTWAQAWSTAGKWASSLGCCDA